jgi:hypothetical protein
MPSSRRQRGSAGAGHGAGPGRARHPAVRRNRSAIEELRAASSLWWNDPRLTLADLVSRYETLLADIDSMEVFRAAPLKWTSGHW